MSGYLTGFKEIKCIFFLIKNDQLLEKYNKIWEKTSKMLYKKDFIGNRLTINNTKSNFMNVTLIQIFIVEKYPKLILITFACQYYYMIQFLM